MRLRRIVSVPVLVRLINEGREDAENIATEIKSVFSMCVRQCVLMVERADAFLAVLESDADEATKLEEADHQLDTFMLVLMTMEGETKNKVDRAKSLCKACSVGLLDISNSIAGIAEASQRIASGLADEAVGPVKNTVTLARTLCDDFFGPALKAAESVEDAMPRVLEEVKKVTRPRGSDIPSLISETLRVKREFKALGDTLRTFTVKSDLETVLRYLENAKPIVELFDV